MDFNNLKDRLSRTLTSLNARFEENIDKQISIETTVVNTPTHVRTSRKVVFGNDSLDVITNNILMILYNLSSLKDHLKTTFKNKGLDPNIVETKINTSLYLQVLIDLVNQEKHGYPLRNPRSNKNPLLANISQGLRMTNNNPPLLLESGDIDFPSFFNNANLIALNSDGSLEHSGDNKIVILADVLDDKNNRLFDIDELVETSYNEFEALIGKYNIL